MTWLTQVILLAFLLLSFRASSLLVEQLPTASLPKVQADEVATITGRVVSDVYGLPINAAKIILIDPDEPDTEIAAGITDDAGFYTVTQTISNTWIIRFDPNSSPDLILFLPEYYDDTYDLADATPVVAEVGTVIPNINASLASPGQLSGYVTAQDGGTPIADVRVTAIDPVSNAEFNAAYTDHTGAYTVTLYSQGAYKLRFDPRDLSGYAMEYYNDKATLGKAQTITFEEGRDLRLNVTLEMGGVITGVLTSTWLGKLIELPNVTVFTEQGEEVQSGGRNTDDPSRPDAPPGHYGIYNLPAGTYQLRFSAQNHRNFWRTTPVTVVPGKTTGGINGTLVINPLVASIATSSGAPNTIALVLQHDPTPIVTTDGGLNWFLLSNSTWVADGAAFAYPDRNTFPNVTAGVAPRGAPGEGTRLLVNVGTTTYTPDLLRPGLYRSGDNGQSWADTVVDPPLNVDDCTYTTFSAPVTTMHSPDHIYMLFTCAHQETLRLLVSDNSGVTWQDVTTKDARTLLLYTYAQIVPSPLVNDLVYIFDGREQWYQSTNGGFDWEVVNFPVQSLALEAGDATMMVGWTPRQGSPWTRYLQRSTDGGATWQDLPPSSCPYSVNEIPPQLLAHPTEPQVLFLRCENDLTNGLYRSTDGAKSWTKITQANGQLLAADFGTPGRILWAKDDGLWASTDNGDTWHVILQNYRLSASELYLPTVSSGN